jgi:hypothetical protein
MSSERQPNPNDLGQTRYFRKGEVARRYAMSIKSVTRLLNHPDATQRLPRPALVVNQTPYWSEPELERFELEQMELSKSREIKRPKDEIIPKRGDPRRVGHYPDDEDEGE